MKLLVALLACAAVPTDLDPPASELETNISSASMAPVVEVSTRRAVLPVGEVIVRECYHEASVRRTGSTFGTGMGAAAPPPMPAPSPARPSRAEDGAVAARTEAVSAEKRKATPETTGADAEARRPVEAEPQAAAEQAIQAPSSDPAGASLDAIADVAPLDDAHPFDPSVRHSQGPVLEWGATVHLSNDDSMSLASAQRVLYATERGVRLSPSEIRPHELLNYFSFDTATPARGSLFGVQGAASLDGDTLSVALAVQGAMPARQPLDLSLVVDRSGSMGSEGRMAYTQRGMRVLTESLQPGDRIDLVLFDSSVCTPLENYVVGRDDPALLTSAIEAMRPRGSTNLDAGLREAYRIQTGRSAGDVHKRNRRVMLLTDAQLNTGNVNRDLVSEVGRQFEENGIRLTGVGVGRGFDDEMLDKLTEKGKGAYVFLGSEAVVDRVFGPGFASLTQTLAHDVRFALDLPDSLAMEKFYGEEASTNPEDVMPVNYYAGTSQVFLQDLSVRDLSPRDPLVLTITWRDAATGEPDSMRWKSTVGALIDADSRNVHKAQALMAWSDVLIGHAMGDRTCGDALGTYARASRAVDGDAELAFVDRLTGGLCGVEMDSVPVGGVSFKVRVDSDTAIAGVGLRCGGADQRERLSGSDTLAVFDDASAGRCVVILEGAVDMEVPVQVPEPGGAVRCLVRGGRVACS